MDEQAVGGARCLRIRQANKQKGKQESRWMDDQETFHYEWISVELLGTCAC